MLRQSLWDSSKSCNLSKVNSPLVTREMVRCPQSWTRTFLSPMIMMIKGYHFRTLFQSESHDVNTQAVANKESSNVLWENSPRLCCRVHWLALFDGSWNVLKLKYRIMTGFILTLRRESKSDLCVEDHASLKEIIELPVLLTTNVSWN